MSENSKKRAANVLFADLSIVFVLAAIDQLSKYFALRFNWPRSLNSGISYSLNLPDNLEIYLSAFLLLALGLIYLKLKGAGEKFIIVLFLAGGASNLIDRLSRGVVVDIFQIPNLFFFNFADLYITLGVLIFIYSKLKNLRSKNDSG